MKRVETKRQKSRQLELAFDWRGEVSAGKESVEGSATGHGEGHSRLNNVMERVVERANMTKAYKRVRKNKGAPGVDGMTVKELMPYLKSHGKESKSDCSRGPTSQRLSGRGRSRSRAEESDDWGFQRCWID